MDWTAPQQALSELWELFAERRGDNGRDLVLLLARRSYSLTELGSFFGVSHPAIARAVTKAQRCIARFLRYLQN
jgi:hypothetical protein